MFSTRNSASGFTLIEVLMIVTLIGILVALSTTVLTSSSNEAKFTETLSRMHQIQNAMIGDPNVRQGGVRASFGFLGDIGAIPTAAQGVAALVAQPIPNLPVYGINAAARIGIGWNGPYLTASSAAVVFTQDAWGNAFNYTPPTLTSLGADGIGGGTGYNQDIVLTMSSPLLTTTVFGFVCQTGGPLANTADVVFNTPDGAGGLSQTCVSLALASAGQFSFPNIPLGVRSVTVYVPSGNCPGVPPAPTLGPVVITVDKPNYVIPCNQLDISP